MADGMDTVERRLMSMRAQLEVVENELDGWITGTAQECQSLSPGMLSTLLDTLYSQILDEAFRDFSPKEKGWEVRLTILHTFLCTAERTSTSVVLDLLLTSDYTYVAEKLLSDLHAVLYRQHGRVLAYHKFFSDFIFDQNRSGNFWCNQGTQHQLLAEACFRCMRDGLRFNIANIPSSFVLDVDNPMLAYAIKENIHPVLEYSCLNWSYHVSAAASTIPNGLHDTITEFMELRALFWIEAMSLLRLRSLCGSMLQTVYDWVISSQGNLSLAEELNEARSFALYFSGSNASSSTPHLYISALATWPRNLDPCRRWKSHFSRIPGSINDSLGTTVLMTLHTHMVDAVAFSPDGKQIVSGSRDNLVWIWDASTGDELKVLKGHTGRVTSVALSLDGKQIVSGSDDNSGRVWDASTGDELKVLKGHTRHVDSVAFSPDGKQIVSGSSDNSVRVWDVSTGKELKVLKGHTNLVVSVAFSPDGKQIVSGSFDNSVWIWDVSTGNKLKVLTGHTYLVTSVAFSPDGKQIVSGSFDNSVRVWDVSTGKAFKVLKGHTHRVISVTFSPDGKQIISGSVDESVRVWDASTGDELKVLKGHTDVVTSVAFSPDGKQIVSGSFDKSVRVWNIGPPYIRETILNSNHHEKYTGWLLSPDGQYRLMFVPPEWLLPDTPDILTIPGSSCSSVDLAHSALGPQWEQCYHP